jgi:carboxymethylenebutenolidase
MEKKFEALYQDYLGKKIERRDFLRKATVVLGSTVAASTFVPLFESNYAQAAGAPGTSNGLHTEDIVYQAETGDMMAYLARPKADKKYPAVIVIHENRGLQPHIRDVNRRMAAEGFLSIAPDALSPVGGTPVGNDDEARAKFREIDMEKTIKNFTAAVKYLKNHPHSNGKVGCTGFCWGGAMTNHVAVNAPDLDAAVPYYGSAPKTEDVPKIKAAVWPTMQATTKRINSGSKLRKSNERGRFRAQDLHLTRTPARVQHDTNPARYNPEAANWPGIGRSLSLRRS